MTEGADWTQHNRELMQEACAALTQELKRLLSPEQDKEGQPVYVPQPYTLPFPDTEGSAFGILAETFALDTFEQWALLFAAAMELCTADLLPSCALELGLGEDVMRGFLSPYALQQWLPDADPAAFAASGHLRKYGLIQLRASGFETSSDALHALRITPGALAYLQGAEQLSAESARVLDVLTGRNPLGQGQLGAVQEVRGVYAAAGDLSRAPVINLYGADLESGLDVVRSLELGHAWVLNLDRVVRALQRREQSEAELLAHLTRDVYLLGATLVIHSAGTPEGPDGAPEPLGLEGWNPNSFIAELCATVGSAVIFISPDPLVLDLGADLYAVQLTRPTPEEQGEFWAQALQLDRLGGSSQLVQGKLRELTTQFSFSAGKIAQVARDAVRHTDQLRHTQPTPDAEAHASLLLDQTWEACKRQGRKVFQGLAERRVSRAGWDDLILPPEDTESLREIVAQVRLRHQVYGDWGYGQQERGLGITALFAGTSGGGKTFTAEVIANALNLDLYRIDLSAIASKWVGETEKNLKKLFDAADEGGAILLFDEADSVFGKRGEASSSNDRYANQTTNYLLQRMEAYRGLAILTTNFEGNIDSAFTRRIRFTIRFHEPDEKLRAQLWERAFPAHVQTQDLNYRLLARPKLTGANIKAIAMNAAFLAAAQGTPITMPVVQEATRRELRRSGKLILADPFR